jgi:hypothetical protein
MWQRVLAWGEWARNSEVGGNFGGAAERTKVYINIGIQS